MASGIQLPEHILGMFNTDLKKEQKLTYMIFKIIEKEKVQEISLSKTGTLQDLKEGTTNYKGNDDEADFKALHESMREMLTPAEPCFLFYDFQYTDRGQSQKKILFLSWIPEESPIRKKMIQASTYEAIKRQVNGIKAVQANDNSETEYDYCKEKALK